MSVKKPGPLKAFVYVLIALSAIIILLYFLFPAIQEELKFVIAVVGGASVICAAYYTGVALHRRIYYEKKQRSFEILRDLNVIENIRIRNLIDRQVDYKSKSSPELYNEILGKDELYCAVNTLLSLLEDISIAIQDEYVDEEVLFLSLQRIVPWAYEGLKFFIDAERERYKSTVMFIELEKLAHAWSKSKSLRTGKCFI
jgi:hypothetical protein